MTAIHKSTPAGRWRPRREHLPLAFFVGLLVVAVPVLFHAGRHQWFFLDEFDFLAGRDLRSFDDLFRPHNEHWSTPPIVVYRLLFRIVGLNSYAPYLALSIGAHLALVCLLRRVMRRSGVDPWIATAAVIPFTFFGTGNENILWGFQFAWSTSVACGILHVIAIDHDGPVGRRDLLGLLFGLIGLMSSGVGLVMVGAAMLTALARRGWREALLHTVPLATLYVIWLTALDVQTASHAGQGDIPALAVNILVDSVAGLGGSVVAGAALLLFSAVGVALALDSARRTGAGWRRLAAPGALACAAVAFAGLSAYGRAFLSPEPAIRYLHVTAAMLIPLVGVGANAVVKRWPKLTVVAAALLLVGLPANVSRLDDRNPLVLGNREQMLSLATVAHDDAVDRSVRPLVLWSDAVTAGWLSDGIESGRIPRIELTTAQHRHASASLALQVLPDGASLTCTSVAARSPLDLDEGEVVRFEAASLAAVEVLGQERSPSVNFTGALGVGTTTVRAVRPVVLEEPPGSAWPAMSICRA
ncbi:MAG: hypothetical protein GX643_11885 [Acidimicrobiales bacterium]|nr:hypothetical protein [Acidimicrobiales bacterium]